MSGFQKNVTGQKWMAFAFNRTDSTPKTGDAGNITAKIRKDYGTATGTNDANPTEIEDGYYEFDLTQAETNADVLDLLPESSTADIQVIGISGRVFTVPPNFSDLGIETDGDLTKVNTLDGHTAQTGNSFARLGAPAGASVSADVAAAKVDTAAILVDTATLGAPAGASHAADIAAIKAETVLIVADTGALQPDWVNGGRLDLIVDAILVDTATLGAPAGATHAADIAAIKSETALIVADTNELQTDNVPGLIAALNDLSAAQVNTEVDNALDTATPGSPTAGSINETIKRLARSVGAVQEFTVDTGGFAATTTQCQVDAVDIDSLETTDDHYIGRVIVFTSGALKHQVTDITDYDGTNKRFSYTALTEVPGNNDTFIVV